MVVGFRPGFNVEIYASTKHHLARLPNIKKARSRQPRQASVERENSKLAGFEIHEQHYVAILRFHLIRKKMAFKVKKIGRMNKERVTIW